MKSFNHSTSTQPARKVHPVLPIAVVVAISIIAAVAVAFASPGDPGRGFFAAMALALPVSLLGYWAWHALDRRVSTAWLMFLAFALRLGFGLATQNLLPVYGYTHEPQQQLGYLFDDAWRRDDEAWRLTTSEKEAIPLSETFTFSYNNDQYGGLAALSIWIYRLLSPDARRFGLIVMLGAAITAIGVPFLRKGIESREKPRLTLVATLIYVLYPDAIVYAGAPMREPFLIGILAIVLWALFTMEGAPKRSALVLIGCLLAMAPLSFFVVGAALIAIGCWFWTEVLIPRSKTWLTVGIVLIVIGVLLGIAIGGGFIQEYIHYDIHTTENNSGWVEKVVGEIGGSFRTLFLGVYGITQPVLPAILFYQPTTPYWKVVGIYRAAGWYLIVAALFYALFSTRKVADRKKRTTLIVQALFLAGWILVSSIRAGGDQWDNPRYRVIFLPWIATFVAWGIEFALETKDWWLVRWVAIEAVFVGFFSQWYYSRYSGNAIRRFPFWKTVVYIFVCAGAIFMTGWVKPLREKWREFRTHKDPEKK